MDRVDREILKCLRKDGRMSNQALAGKVNLAPSAVLKRVRHLEEQGVLAGFTARIDHAALGLCMNVLISVITNESAGDIGIGSKLAAFPDICDVYDVAGNTSYIVRAVVKDTAALNDLIVRMGKIPGVMRTQTTLIMNILKNELSVEP